MGSCKDCVFYRTVDQMRDTKQDGPNCRSPHIVMSYGRVASPDGVTVEADEHWGCVVGPDYGCIHFQREGGVPEDLSV